MSALVSIIIPAFNAEKYISACVDSAFAQSWDNKEIIVVDDGSADKTRELLERYSGRKNFTLICRENCGAAAARNAGLKAASGAYIQFLDADDLLHPEKIALQMASLNDADSCLATCHTVHFTGEHPIDQDIAPASEWFSAGSDDSVGFLLKLYAGDELMPGYGGMIALHSWLTPVQLIDRAGIWDERLSVDDDGEFFCRVVLAARGIRYTKGAVCYYRKYTKAGESLSAQKNLRAMESTVLAADLKMKHLASRADTPLLNKIFARHYWWAGVIAYPQYKKLSARCISKAQQLGYCGEKYVGGPGGHRLAAIAGWKVARIIGYYLHKHKTK